VSGRGIGRIGEGGPKRWGPIVALAIALAIAATAPAVEAGELSVVERGGGAARKHAIEDYWTPARMREARPLEAIRSRGDRLLLRRTKADQRNHPTAFESAGVPDPAVFPNTVHGKLFGRISGVGGYTCSATVVEAANRSTLVTAGHCAAEPGLSTAKKLAFVPAYDRKARPFGTWVFERIVTQRAWRRRANFNFDFAAVEMSPNEGILLQDAAGAIPAAPFLPVEQTYVATGYPANRRDTEVMWRCTSPFEGYDPRPIPNGPTPFAIGCDMGVGASGGGLTVDGALASVVSFGYEDHRNVLYAPYFGRKLVDVYERAANG
jgi:Trypsin